MPANGSAIGPKGLAWTNLAALLEPCGFCNEGMMKTTVVLLLQLEEVELFYVPCKILKYISIIITVLFIR
jgi:hypothetical protein